MMFPLVRKCAPWLVILALGAWKMWLVSDLLPNTSFPSLHDDGLFLRQAKNLLSGNWLGPYDRLTLIKGPGYPMWIAAMHVLGIPLLWARQLLYVLACVALAAALKRYIRVPLLWVLVFALVLLNPVTFDVNLLRLSRNGTYAAWTVGVIAGLVGLHAARDRSRSCMAAWATGLGASFGAFWLTREEGLWLLPAFLCIPFYTGWTLRRSSIGRRWTRVSLCLLPHALWGLIVFTVSTINQQYYGVNCITELGAPEFQAAIGTLGRAEPQLRRRRVPVPLATRRRLYEVSPSFKRLEPYLEGRPGGAWRHVSRRALKLSPEEADIGGGWFIWAMREAVELAGFHQDAPQALAFYESLAREVGAACDAGRLTGRRAESLAPPWHPSYGPLLLDRFLEGICFVATFSKMRMRNLQPATRGTREQINTVEALIGGRLWRPPSAGKVALPEAGLKKRIQGLLTILYQVVSPTLAAFSVVAYLITSVLRARRRLVSFLWVLNTALIAVVVVRTLLLAYLDVTAFPSIHSQYCAPQYALLLLFLGTALLDLMSLVRAGRGAARARLPDTLPSVTPA